MLLDCQILVLSLCYPFVWDTPIKPIVGNKEQKKYSLVVDYSISPCLDSNEKGVWSGGVEI